MRGSFREALLQRPLLVLATVAALATLFPGRAVWGQSSRDEEPVRARKTPTMRGKVYDVLSQAEALAENENFEEALNQLGRVEKIKDLTPYEKAQLYTAYGYVHFSREDYAESIRAYENVIRQEELPEALESSTLYTLAQLQFHVEAYEKAIEHLQRWLSVVSDPGPEPYVLLGQAYYQLERYQEAIEPVETAIRIAKRRGRAIEEHWYLLLRVFYYELQNYPKVLEILETLVQQYPNKDYWVHLAAMYGETGDEEKQLTAYEIAYLQGFLRKEREIVLLSQLLLQAEVPYRAAAILKKGMDEGRVESSVKNYRLLSQAWTLAHEDDRAIVALKQAAELSDDGELDARLALSYVKTDEWEMAASAARSAIEKGVEDVDQVQILLGMALFELDQYEEAKGAFRAARDSPESKNAALQWLSYIEGEQERLRDVRRSLQP